MLNSSINIRRIIVNLEHKCIILNWIRINIDRISAIRMLI